MLQLQLQVLNSKPTNPVIASNLLMCSMYRFIEYCRSFFHNRYDFVTNDSHCKRILFIYR